MKLHPRRPSAAMVVACFSLFIGLSGVGTAAVVLAKNSVLSKHIRNNQVQSVDVKDASLRAQDFAPGQIPPGAQGPQGERGLQGERGAQGPGASKILYSAPANAIQATDVATVGPWTIQVFCAVSSGQTSLEIGARGPGAAQWSGTTATNDSNPTSATGGTGLHPTLFTSLAIYGLASAGDFQRLAVEIQLQSTSEVATVSLNGLADRRGAFPGACALWGTAVPGS